MFTALEISNNYCLAMNYANDLQMSTNSITLEMIVHFKV